MENNGEKPEVPQFKEVYLEAFLCLMLKKLGGYQTIPLALLEKFPKKSKTKVFWNERKKAFTIVAPESDVPLIVKRKRKLIIGRN